MKIVFLKDGEKSSITIKKFLKKYNPFLTGICNRWINSFYFDNAITKDDLLQELRIKIINDIHSYDYERGSLFTFIKTVSQNFFINKRSQLLVSDRYPTDADKNIITIKSLYETSKPCIRDSSFYVSQFQPPNNPQLIETIPSYDSMPDHNLEYKALVNHVRMKLNSVKYTPKGFFKRKTSFVCKVFDILLDHNDRFYDQILFDHKCKLRMYDNYKLHKKPNKIYPNTRSIARFIGVDIRTINKAFKIIREIIDLTTLTQLPTEEAVSNGESLCKKKGNGKIRRTPYKENQEIQA